MLNNITKLLFIPLLLFISSCGEESREHKIIVGLSTEYAPFEYSQDEKIIGFDVDLANKIVAELKRPIEIKNIPFERLISELEKGSIDMIVSAITPTSERKKIIDFSNIYYRNNMAIIFKKSNNIMDLEDLKGKVVAARIGTTMEEYIKEQALDLQLNLFSLSDNNQLLDNVKSGHVYALITDQMNAIALVQKNPELSYIELSNYNPERLGYAVAVKKGSELVDKVNNILADLSSSGQIKELEAKWIDSLIIKASENQAILGTSNTENTSDTNNIDNEEVTETKSNDSQKQAVTQENNLKDPNSAPNTGSNSEQKVH